jgi:hypothetical protein
MAEELQVGWLGLQQCDKEPKSTKRLVKGLAGSKSNSCRAAIVPAPPASQRRTPLPSLSYVLLQVRKNFRHSWQNRRRRKTKSEQPPTNIPIASLRTETAA